jgi:predicted RNA-binding Zn ribbon-like protein
LFNSNVTVELLFTVTLLLEQSMTIQYPLLGEPVVVELINTLYVDDNGTIDFLADADLAQGWLIAVRDRIEVSIVLCAVDVDALRELRNAIRLATTIDSKPSSKLFCEAIDTINRAASLSPITRLLRWNGSKPPTLATPPCHVGINSLLSRFAADAIDIIAGTANGEVAICGRPACTMRFLRQHHRRRYCNVRCANADRQSRYYKRASTAP